MILWCVNSSFVAHSISAQSSMDLKVMSYILFESMRKAQLEAIAQLLSENHH